MNELVFPIFEKYRRFVFVLSGTVVLGWLYNRLWVNRRLYSSRQSINGKTVLITGGNTGIGYETAKDLLQRGARVIIACRNLNKGHEAIEKLIDVSGCSEESIRLMECDLSSLESVRRLAKLVNEEEERLDVLICNAGLGYSTTKETEDGFNSVIQTNYLSHFLLTNLLLDKLKQSKSSRIINVSSDLHQIVKSIDWSDALTQKNQSSLMGSYPISKLFQILSTYQLQKRLSSQSTINVFSLTPGFVSTSIRDPMEESIGFFSSIIYYPLIFLSKQIFAKTPQSGAQTSIFCAVEPTLDTSSDLYFQNCAVARSSPLSIDSSAAQKLWSISCEAVGI